ncbi:MAG: glycosyltransferase [Crocinitomicaceae bacterium]|nr:glycosyltransferase [Crocinitomicaceae bacterium]
MGRLAIISTNRNQYSETFIQSHIDLLPFQKVVYTNGYLPTDISLDQGLTSEPLLSKKSLWKSSTPRETLTKSFRDNNIRAVLAEYGPAGVEVMDICENLNIPLIVHFHGYDAYRDDVLNSYGIKYQKLFRSASAIIGVSKDMCEQLKTLGCPEEKLHDLPYGIATDLFTPENKSSSKKFVACGRFVPKKAPQLTIQAFKRVVDKHSDAQLEMIGNGELMEECKELTNQLEIAENVKFLGVLDQKEIAKIYQGALAFVQHSKRTADNDSEGTPLAILEASAAGLPIISTRHAGIIDIVDDEVTGFLVDEGDVVEMANKMLLLADSTELANEMGAQGSKKINKQYRKEDYIDKLASIIHDCGIEKQS